jgi:Cu/Ag efflux pump CusA
MLSGTRANIAIKIFGSDLNRMNSLGNQIKNEIQGIEGLVDLSVEPQIEIPQIQIKAKRELLNHYGITIGQFNELVDVGLSGEKVSEIYEENRSFDLIVRFDPENRGKMEDILNTQIDTHSGEKIPLHYVAEIVSASGPNTINRENVQRKTVVSANVSGRDQKSVVDEVRQRISDNINCLKDIT